MNEVAAKSKAILRNKKKACAILVLAMFWLLIVESVPHFFEFNKLIKIALVLPAVLYWAVVAHRWLYALCPMCNKPMFRRMLVMVRFSQCAHCGYDLKNVKSSGVYKRS